MSEKNKELKMEFDPNTIQHLGISMYSTLPPVLGELVANSYDADSSEVHIYLHDAAEPKHIIVRDKGIGMSFDELNDKYLKIGRNKRECESRDSSAGGRPFIGRKGIGKLSAFGITNEIKITSVKDNLKNSFRMSFEEIQKSPSPLYKPTLLTIDTATELHPGTEIVLENVQRKSAFDPQSLANDLAKRFLIYGDDFKVFIYHNSEENPIQVNNELRFNSIDIDYEWEFPNTEFVSDYQHKEDVKGKIFVSQKPVSDRLQGVYLVVHGKLANRNEFFGLSAHAFAYSYITGYLEVDFIDIDRKKDLIATNRESLNWSHPETQELKEHLQKLIKFVVNDLSKKKESKKKEYYERKTGNDLDSWVAGLPASERKLASKMVSIPLKSDGLDNEKSAELIDYVKDSFGFHSFKELASQIDENDLDDDKVLQLFKDWELIESKEFHKLSIVRIEAIEKFKEFIKQDVKEVPTMHQFLKKFPWLLDPRINNFEDEVHYSDILRERFLDAELPESDRRIDFLCVDFADIVFIIELKRPSYTIDKRSLEQAIDYSAFLEKNLGTEFQKRVSAIVIGGQRSSNESFRKMEAGMVGQGITTKTYTEILHMASKYHSEFIKKYDDLLASRRAD